MTDDDRVPAECCHPVSCFNKVDKGICTLLCSNVCEGPIDCGAGRCGCVNGKCGLVVATLTCRKIPAAVIRSRDTYISDECNDCTGSISRGCSSGRHDRRGHPVPVPGGSGL